jgi:acetyl esterase/lipase
MTRSRCIKTLFAAATALFLSGCQSLALGVANLGTGTADASIVYDAENDLSLDVYRPRQAAAGAPVVVFFYGGNWKTGSRGQYRFVGRRLADSGFVTIVADYRTYPRATFPGFVEDAARATDWALANARQYGGDPARVFVAGHSAGAQIAALLGTDARYLAAHGSRPRDLAGVIGLSGPYDFVVGTAYAPVFGPKAQWPLAQAVNFVDGDEPPFLLVHGLADRVVEARDSQQLAEKLRGKGGSATLLLLEDAGHVAPVAALFSPGREPRVLRKIEEFVRGSRS